MDLSTSYPNPFSVVVTGAASGIGLRIASAFIGVGAKVTVWDSNVESMQKVQRVIPEAVLEVVDVTDFEGVEGAVARARRRGRIDVLVNNAMVCSETPFLAATPKEIRRDVEVNLIGPMFATQAVLPTMIEQAAGVIVNIASVNALTHLGNEAYSAAKAGMLSLTRSIAAEFGPRGIRCNAVAAGTVESPFWVDRIARDPSVLEKVASWYPLRRIGRVDDISDAVLFLASPLASWITGAVLPVDGGLMAGNTKLVRELHAMGSDD